MCVNAFKKVKKHLLVIVPLKGQSSIRGSYFKFDIKKPDLANKSGFFI